MLWQLLLLAAALGAAYYRWSRRRLYRLARELPSGLKEYPLVGHAYIFHGSGQDQIKAIQDMGRAANQRGGLISVWMTHRLFVDFTDKKLIYLGKARMVSLYEYATSYLTMIGMTDPEAIEVVTRSCLEKGDFFLKIARMVLGNSSIFAPVSIWHPRRKIMAPFFNLKNLNQLVPMFQQKSSLMVDLMKSEAGGGDFPIWKYMTTYAFDTIFENALGINLNSQQNPEHFVVHAVDKMMHMVAHRMLQLWLHPDCVYQRLPAYKQFKTLRQEVYAFADEIIQSTKKKLEATELNDENSNGWKNFLDLIIRTSGGPGKGYTDLELREECMVLIAAANDTSAVCLSFTAVLLSRYPDVQDKVYRELHEVIGDSDRDITREDLPKLKYLEAVIKESLRLYPPVPMIVREVHNDTKLPSGTTLVDGTGVMIYVWGTNRHPSYWGADAELFRPERFLEGPLRHPAQFIPFSYSVRNCVGATYGMLSMKTALANLVRRYRLLPPADMAAVDLMKPLQVESSVILKATDDFVVRVEERNKIV